MTVPYCQIKGKYQMEVPGYNTTFNHILKRMKGPYLFPLQQNFVSSRLWNCVGDAQSMSDDSCIHIIEEKRSNNMIVYVFETT